MYRRTAATLAVVAFISLTGCGIFTKSGEESEMTPDEAFTKLETDMTTVIEAIAPNPEQPYFDSPPPRNVPCGGFAGTDETRLSSSLHGLVAPAEWDKDIPAAVQRVQDQLSRVGYSVRQSEQGKIDNRFGFYTEEIYQGGNFRISVRFSKDGAVRLSGETPCLDNPNSVGF